jgi:hypothetical protein
MSAVPPRPPQPSGWAMGGVTFAASMLGLIGIFQVIAGLTAIFNDSFFVATRNYTFDLDITAWGWIHLILGILMLGTCVGLIAGKLWAGMTALFLTILVAVDNFFFIPNYPLWSLVVIALCVWVIWALTRPGAIGGDWE